MAALLAGLRERGVPVVHVVTEYRELAEIAANPFWKAAHDDPGKARRGILRHNLAGSPGTEIIAELHDPRDRVVRGKKRYSSFHATDLEFLLRRALSFTGPLRFLPHRNEHGERLFREACEKGLEGVIANRTDSR